MGLRKGERIRPLATIEVVSVRQERLDQITDDDVRREGYPGKPAAWFIEHFCKAMKCGPFQKVTRIEFVYLEPSETTIETATAIGIRVGWIEEGNRGANE